jgi:hypothetical protein
MKGKMKGIRTGKLTKKKNELLTNLDYNREYFTPGKLADIERKIMKGKSSKELKKIETSLLK